jgi:LmbE family N-acetylglucosaminyl deacetylase
LLAGEGLDAWAVPEVWFLGAPARLLNHAVDVTDTFDTKLAALREHRSQTARLADLRAELEPEFSRMARLFDLPEGRLAEAFHVVATG